MLKVAPISWLDPLRALQALAGRPQALLLDSALVGSAAGRWSFLCADPFARFRVQDGRAFVDDRPVSGDPFAALGQLLARYPQARRPDLPPFYGGAAGFWGYDLARTLERLPELARDDLGLPQCVLGLYDAVACFDMRDERALIVSSGYPETQSARRATRAERRAEELAALLERAAPAPALAPPGTSQCRATFARHDFEAAVARVVAYINAGDLFQANVAQRFDVSLAVDQSALDVYRRLREISPAPYAAYVDAGDGLVLVSSSPERFLRVDGNQVETRPIKGTRARGSTALRDRQLASELLCSAKDRAENVMIVDLLRNDLSKVCQDDSVEVSELCRLERFATVQHLVSTARGRLRGAMGPVDALRACFPGGSISGAPKVRAMEIIEQLEPTRRGPYCGAIGYIGFDGSMDTSIAIRTIVCAGERAVFQVGGGIVADSDPAAEYEETLVKARAMAQALGVVL